MTKHFEELWLEAEQTATDTVDEKLDAIKLIQKQISSLHVFASDPEGKSPQLIKALRKKVLGEILFGVAYLSKTDNINVYTALQDAMNAAKIAALEGDEDA